MKLYIITGPPYSGKGTQCEELKKKLNLVHISTGDRCREEEQNETETGIAMAKYTSKGDLVPDALMQELFSKILDENLQENGIILDGYPRTIPQVDHLLELTTQKGLVISKVLNIEVPKDELLKRALKRAETSTREDDKNPATHLKRIDVFESVTKPAIEYMKSKLSVNTFNGLGSVEDITNSIKSVL